MSDAAVAVAVFVRKPEYERIELAACVDRRALKALDKPQEHKQYKMPRKCRPPER